MTTTTTTTSARTVLKQTFGYDQFRGEQQAIIDCLLQGGDALVLMPTGGGKSLCYQLPSLLRQGVGIVVSPLIALMQDQVTALHQLGIRAAFLNSTLNPYQQQEIEQALRAGNMDLLYVAPERLLQPRTRQLLTEVDIALFAIDEAHCVSQWGHDFRKDYLGLSVLHEQFPAVPRIALTATADGRTQQEIIQRLNLGHAGVFISGFDRPNIHYAIAEKKNAKQQLLKFLATHQNDAGIVYCMSRKKVEGLAHWLCDQGFTALPYHAGLPTKLREQNQNRFLREDGIIIVATIAFGMGIDKPDVRFVAHLDLPKSIEAYYQETGRAGRDSLPADAWMVYGLQDVVRLKQMQAASQAEEQFKRVEQIKLDALLGLCEVTSCRRQVLLRYFGETHAEPCGNCDICLMPPKTWDATEVAQKILSTVYRTDQRFGVNHVIDVLLGNETEKILRFQHQNLSTYGIGQELSAVQWRSVIRQLLARGLLHVNMDAYGALQLTPECRSVLRGETKLQLRKDTRPKHEKEKTHKKPILDPVDRALWEALKDCRQRLAQEQGVPPYVVFHDATLRELVRFRPRTHREFLMINGVGENKLKRYADSFIRVIEDCAANEFAG